MRIITINLWGYSGPWQARWPVAAQQLAALAPDVVCVQEAVPEVHGLGLPVVAFDETSALAVLARLPVISTRLLDLGRSPLEPTSRMAIEVDFGGWHVFNTHLAWRMHDGDSRRMQAAALASHGLPRGVVCGDLNCEWDSPELEPLRCLGLRHALDGRPHATRPTWDNRNPYTLPYRTEYPDSRLDHILTDLRVLDASLVLDQPDADGHYPSDHFGVMADVDVASLPE